ncbi:UPF0182 family protein [Lusitaniella coriacea LEGE 07157]|uniref:UPF0182 protein IQ249_16275 n=1 Tax=Lusitaniella coriacea LEGE 07157 TaxID=945747 RepID=A0A8J7DY94_9CYAN|nr:UPF0182 family protein [Lusitaniella coriacea]MBE9117458.1 UPF0182 family protein [Lusitaniella coriacea LEGE 07157]
MKSRQNLTLILLLTTFVLLAVSSPLVHLLVEAWWFESVGFEDAFWTRIRWQILIGAVTFIVYGLFLGGNALLAMNLSKTLPKVNSVWNRSLNALEYQGLGNYADKLPKYAIALAVILASVAAAVASVASWETVLKFLQASSFGRSDPIFQRDIGFYVFRLPFYEGIQRWFLVLLGAGFVGAVVLYNLKGMLFRGKNWQYALARPIKTHLSLLLAAIALLLALGFWLGRYKLLYSGDGAVFGAGYADVHARLQAYWLMMFVTFALAILLIVSLWRRGLSLPIYGIIAYFVIFTLVDGAYPWLQQQLVVEPNELAKEEPYIAYNIEATRQAYDLNRIQTQNYSPQANLTRQDLQANQSTLDNIRLWDYRPLLSTYRQLQEIRLYYHFKDVDIDRYTLDGDYRQVMLSARELAYRQVPTRAKTWVNQRLKYTHGYGLAMSPVNTVTPNGLPELFIKNIPPTSTVDLKLTEPAIYYGEETDSYIFTRTRTEEFDYPQGDENALTRYDGKGGVPMGSPGRRLAYAYDFGNLKILISNYFNQTSHIHYHRLIADRVKQVAPFLKFDRDPYITVIDGKLEWIIDAYTTSDRYPYSEPVTHNNLLGAIAQEEDIQPITAGDINYIRNAVKVVIDAYNGTMRFYVVDEQDPILQTYRKIFPDLFEPSEAISPEIRAHFRYPLDLFKIQAKMYLAYHMENPDVFYNREDLWRFPLEIYEGTQQVKDPYYMIMRLPQAESEEFVLISPFTPVNKDNTIAWMAARSDGENYGNLLLYEFPKQVLVYGPSQIEARINQNPEISQQLTLWGQEGSRVIRGDLLIIPIEESLLYVEPIYLRAEQGELPELRRVIVVYENQTVMAKTLDAALETIFGEASPQPAARPVTGDIQSALDLHQKAQTALQQGNWSLYGQYQKQLGNLLEKLNQ